MKTLFIGDVHARSEEIDDCKSLIDFVYKIANEESVDRIVFLGDQHHTHAILHVEVIAFWKEAFTKLKALKLPIIALVGNHDMPGDTGSQSNAMIVYDDIQTGDFADDNFLFVNYKHDIEEFLKICNNYPDKILVCHQTFQGAQYENGFYAAEGVEQANVPSPYIFSGHIHLSANLGRVNYTGSPRWISASDANTDKYIWVVETDGNRVVSSKPFSTKDYCKRIIKLEDTEENPVEIKFNSKDKFLVNIRGSQKYIDSRIGKFFGKAKITTQCTDRNLPTLKESDGIEKSVLKALDAYEPKYVTHEELKRAINERLIAE